MRVRGLAFLLLLIGLVPSAAAWAQGDSGLLITEIYYDTPGRDEDEEWFEIANLGPHPLYLTDYKIGDEEQMGRREGMVRFPDGSTIGPGEVLVIARSAAGFRARFGRSPDFEIRDSDPTIPDLARSALWASGDVALANEGDELLLAGPDNVIRDAVSYGDSDYFFSPPLPLAPTGSSLARIPAHCDSDTAAEWGPLWPPTPGTVQLEGECPAGGDPVSTLSLLPIGAIQGQGDRSPYVGQIVSFEGIVTGAYEDRNTRGIIYHTLFVQALPEDDDGDPATSDGIAVFLGQEPPPVTLGQRVLVSGRVTEFYGFTEIDDAGQSLTPLPWEGAAPPLPDPVILDLPLTGRELEAVESMRVALPEARVVGPTHAGCGFAVAPPEGSPRRPLREQSAALSPAILPVLHVSDVSCAGFPDVKFGDRVAGLVGPLIYHFDHFKLVQQVPSDLNVDAAPLPSVPRPPAPTPAQVSIVSFNLNDYLAAEEHLLLQQRDKLARTIVEALDCPTVVAVQEVQSRALLETLATTLAPSCAFTYEITHRDSADARGIDVALLTNPSRVQVTAAALEQTCTSLDTGIDDPLAACAPGFAPLFSRPPLRAELLIQGQPYTVFVNHFKSKRGGEAETAPRRLAQAHHLRALVSERLRAEEEARIIVLGDFNDYALSPTLLALTAEGMLQNVLLSLPDAERYTFIFDGASQLLDSLLLTPAAAAEAVHVQIVHVNADYPSAWALDPGIPFHSSDHDIPYLLLQPSVREPALTATVPSTAAPTVAVVAAVATPLPAPTSSATNPGPASVPFAWLAGGLAFSLLLALLLLFLRLRAGKG